jgi:hypothetical protein
MAQSRHPPRSFLCLLSGEQQTLTWSTFHSLRFAYEFDGEGDRANSVWKNDEFFNTVLSKSCKDGDEWKDTDQLGTGDLLNAGNLLERSGQFISEQ